VKLLVGCTTDRCAVTFVVGVSRNVRRSARIVASSLLANPYQRVFISSQIWSAIWRFVERFIPYVWSVIPWMSKGVELWSGSASPRYKWCVENVLLFGKSEPNCHSKVLLFLAVRWLWEYDVHHSARPILSWLTR